MIRASRPMLRARAIAASNSQNTGSSATLVLWPATVTDRRRRSTTGSYPGAIMFSGRTQASYCSSLTSSKASAAAFSVLPSAYAFLAIFAALS